MAFSETLIPDSLISTVAILTPTLAEIQTDDTSWFDSTSHAIDTEFRVSMPTPSRALNISYFKLPPVEPLDIPTFESIKQQINLIVRKSRVSAFNPTVRIEVWENGASSVLAVSAELSVTSAVSQTVVFDWVASGLTDLTGADVEVRVVGTRAGSSETGDWAAVEYNLCSWIAFLDPLIPVVSLNLQGYVPRAGLDHVPAPIKAAAVLSGQAVISKFDRFVTPAKVAAVLTGKVPVLSSKLQAPPIGGLALTSKAATKVVNYLMLPAVYAAALISAAPTLLHNSIRTPAKVTSFALSGKTPTLDHTAHHVATPAASNFTLRPKIVMIPLESISAPEGTFVLAGKVPTLDHTLDVFKSPPSVPTFTLGEQSVVRIGDRPRTPAVDIFSLTGQAVGRSVNNVIPIPDAATLSFLGVKPQLHTEFLTLSLDPKSVVVVVNDIVLPAAATLTFNGEEFIFGTGAAFEFPGTLSLTTGAVTFIIQAPSKTDDLKLISLTVQRKLIQIATPARIS